MKNLYNFIFCLLLCSTLATGQQLNQTYTYASGSTHLLGEFRPDALSDAPFQDWYDTTYQQYEPAAAQLAALKESGSLPDSMTIFMGTWCGDSKREVPRMLRLLTALDYDMARVKLIGVSRDIDFYKQSPDQQQYGLNIHRVPTFLLHDAAGNITQRIVEHPVASLEADLLAITAGDDYTPSYAVANGLDTLIHNRSMSWLNAHKDSLQQVLAPLLSKESELNTYALTLYSTKRLGRAAWVLDLNASIYPEYVNSCYWLGMIYMYMGREEEALACMQKASALLPEHEGIKYYVSLLSEWTE